MEKKSGLSFKKGDLLAILTVVVMAVAAFVLFMPETVDPDEAVVHVFQNSEKLYTFPLNENRVFEVAGDYLNTVEIRNGTVCVSDSTCPGMDCVHLGSIRDAGRTLVCLPNRVEIRIEGEAVENEVDFVLR
ncbi:MAG: NusG domain II-containing protein [Clostridia bacterium]|nr:NusG domain II-containing protein [Clostridia bacterium]